MELEFTYYLAMTLFTLLITFLILLKGTRNFIYRTIGLICFASLLFSISYGYMNLIGKPKPLTYEQWPLREESKESQSEKGSKKESKEEGEGQGSSESTMTMDIIDWEENIKKKEAYLWLREQKDGKPEYYSFKTDTKDGKEMLKQLRKAEESAKRQGRQRSSGETGIKLRIIIDTLFMAPAIRFQFFVPPAKILQEKTEPTPGITYPTTPHSEDLP